MTDEPRQRYGRAYTEAERLTAVEVEQRVLARQLDAYVQSSAKIHEGMDQLIKKLDERADRADVRWAQLIAILAIVVVVANIVGPVIVHVWFR